VTIQYLDQRFLSFQEYIDRQVRGGLFDEDGTPRYAHPVDEWILRSLNAMPVRTVLDKSLDTIISIEMGQYLASGIVIDQRSFSDLFEVLSRCAETLGIPIPHAVANDSPYLFNAFTAGTDEYSFINITSGLCRYFSKEEACFVIGHECGHIASKHMVYHTLVWVMTDTASRYLGGLGKIISRTAGIPLLAWSRRSEITADRAGLLCCGDIAVAERALLRLVAGHADVDQVDIEDYLRKFKDVQEFHGVSGWQQLLITHPLIPKRIEALRLFAQSELYHDLTGKLPPAGAELLTREELDRRVNQIVKP
jgi:Zn-dependent protease with chaperone function